MISSGDLAKVTVHRTIFHDVPNNARGGTSKPTLADAETDLDIGRSNILKKRLIQVLGSKSAYPIDVLPEASSPVPEEVRRYTAKALGLAQFIQMSRKMAQHLFELQNGPMSPGLLCVIDVTSGSHRGVAILKLEREQGAELKWRKVNGKQSVQMSVLDNLVLTDGTRLFKAALFLRFTKTEIRAVACDSQNTVHTSMDVARFWLKFLGCSVTEEPRVATQRWFDATVRFVNEHIADPVDKNAIYEHLVSELNSNRTVVTPRRFAEDYVSADLRKLYIQFLGENEIALHQFPKDTSDILSKLRRRSFHTVKGVTVTAPADQQELVGIEAEQIVVHDQLQTIVNK